MNTSYVGCLVDFHFSIYCIFYLYHVTTVFRDIVDGYHRHYFIIFIIILFYQMKSLV